MSADVVSRSVDEPVSDAPAGGSDSGSLDAWAMTQERYDQLLQAIADSKSDVTKEDVAALSEALSAPSPDGAATVLTQDQYDGLMVVSVNSSVCLMLILAVLVILVGMLFGGLATRLWRSR